MTHLGKYKLEGEIGRGTSGVVYRAFDPGVSRVVAIKILSEDNRAQLARFNQKASAAGRLSHRNIVSIFEYVPDENTPYLVMEHLDGENLSEVISSGRKLSILEKASIMAQVADGLRHAHSNGVLHCDIKPANIRILPDGTVKILDFGFAGASETQSAQLANEGDLGTVAYIAPEMFQEGKFDKLCDVYSFGVVYFELITGKNPFGSDHDEISRVIYNIISSDHHFARSFNQECPPKLEQLISRTMLQDRDLRYQSFEDLIVDQAPILSELQWIEVETLIQKAEVLFAAEESGQARAIVLQALKLAPSSIPARTLLRKIDLKAEALEKRQHALLLVSSGRKELNSLEFERAVRTFEKVIELDPDNKEVKELIALATVGLSKVEQHKALISEAEQKLRDGEITEAYKCVLESLHDFPDDPSATALLRRIQNAIDDREQRRLMEERLATAKDLVAGGKLAEAATLLAEIERSSQSAAMKHLVSDVRVAIQNKRQRIKLQNGVGQARALLAAGSWAEALSCLKALRLEFPGESEIQSLLPHAEKQLQIEERASFIKRVVDEAKVANETLNFDRASDLLREGMEVYPDSDELAALLSQTEQLQFVHNKRAAIDATTERAKALASQHSFSVAIDEIDAAAKSWKTHELNALRLVIEGKRIEFERRLDIDRICENVRKHQRGSLFQEALSVGKEALTKYPGEPSLQALIAACQESLEEQLRNQRIKSIRDDAMSRTAQGDFDLALKMVRSSMREMNDPSFDLLCTEIEADREKWNRREAAAEAASNIQKLIQKARFSEAISLGRKAFSEFPEASNIADQVAAAEKSLAEQQRSRQLTLVEQKSDLLLRQRDFEAAICLLRDSIAELGSEPKLEALLTSAKGLFEEKMKSATIQSTLVRARKLLASQNLNEAVELLQEALTKYPGNNLIENLLAEAASLLTEKQEAEATEAVIREGRKALKRGDLQAALELTTKRSGEVSKDPRLAILIADIKRARDQAEQERASQAVLDTAQGLENQGRFNEAVAIVEQALSNGVPEPLIHGRLVHLRERIAKQEKVNATLDKACALIAGSMFEEALVFVQSSIEEHPDETAYPALLDEIKKSMRADAVAKTNREIATLRVSGNLDDAVARVAIAITEFPDEPDFETLQAQINADIAEAHRITLTAEIVSEANRLLALGRVDDGRSVAEEGLQKHPGDESLIALLAKINSPPAAKGNIGPEKQTSERLLSGPRVRMSVRAYSAIAAVLAITVVLAIVAYWQFGGPSKPETPQIAEEAKADTTPPTKRVEKVEEPETDQSQIDKKTTGGATAPTESDPKDSNKPTDVLTPPDPVKESLAWNNLNRQSVPALRQFLADFPNGEHSQEAEKKLKDLEESIRRIQEAIGPQKSDYAAIQKTFETYVSAIKGQDSVKIISILPNKYPAEVDAILKEQKDASDFFMTIKSIVQEKDAAVVSGIQTRTINSGRGNINNTQNFSAKLSRKGDLWVIDSITYVQ